MKTIIGLGNPGKKYTNTRHNVGFLFLNYLQNTMQMPNFKLQTKYTAEISSSNTMTLIKPQTFMNNSGEAVRKYFQFYNKEWQTSLNNIYIAHDDLDLECGTYKIQLGKGPKVHNGLTSIYQHLKTKDIWHIRIGVDSRAGDRSIPGHDYVLAPFSHAENQLLESVFEKIVSDITTVVAK